MQYSLGMNGRFAKFFRWLYLSVLCGIGTGLLSSLFLYLLYFSTTYREANSSITFGLPLIGMFIVYCYSKFGKESHRGNNLILDEIHNIKHVIPLRMAPFVLIGTVLTHLFGGSAGREGTAVQMGGVVGNQLNKIFKLDDHERRIMLAAGSGAGFGAAIGAPWAGVIFGMEFISIGSLRFFALGQSLVASFVGYLVVHQLGTPHTFYPKISMPLFSFTLITQTVLSGIGFGLVAWLFSRVTHLLEKLFSKIKWSILVPFIGGVILLLGYKYIGHHRYTGLGLDYIVQSLQGPSEWFDWPLKLIFTALTLASGFKGGEFTPLVFMGTTFGNSFGALLGENHQFFAALGFAAVFAGASNTPIACAIMAAEIFGISILPYATLACFISYYCSGHNGIYKSQIIHMRKQDRLFYTLRLIRRWLFNRK